MLKLQTLFPHQMSADVGFIGEHFFMLSIAISHVSFKDGYKKAYREIMAEEEKRDFLIYLVAYVLVNAMLVAINFVYSPETIWFFYPLFGWGIGIIVHYLVVVRWIERGIKKKEAEAEYRARESISK
jgi:hypothetical protein